MSPKSGDVGNRTRVRKIRPSNIYERSRLFIFVRSLSTDHEIFWLVAGTRESLFRTFSGMLHAALRLYDARVYLRSESGVGGRGPSLEG